MTEQALLDWPNVQGDRNERAEVLAWDGRLDNRSDLLLRLRDSLRTDTSDAAARARRLRALGDSGLVHLIGDWSLVIRDCAHPHYRSRERLRGRSSALLQPAAGTGPVVEPVYSLSWKRRKSGELDEQYLGGFLMFGGCPNHTPYKGICSVPPGHAVCVSAKETGIRPFWVAPHGDEIRYRSQRRYEEQFRALFREAVAVRLRTDSPVLAELSGGLDSSSVVCMANRSGAKRRRERPASRHRELSVAELA